MASGRAGTRLARLILFPPCSDCKPAGRVDASGLPDP